jgi:hypothetical protein
MCVQIKKVSPSFLLLRIKISDLLCCLPHFHLHLQRAYHEHSRARSCPTCTGLQSRACYVSLRSPLGLPAFLGTGGAVMRSFFFFLTGPSGPTLYCRHRGQLPFDSRKFNRPQVRQIRLTWGAFIAKNINVHMCLMWSIFDSAEQYSTFLSQKGVVLGAGNTVQVRLHPRRAHLSLSSWLQIYACPLFPWVRLVLAVCVTVPAIKKRHMKKWSFFQRFLMVV